MAENIDKEPIDSAPNTQSENSPDEIIPAKDIDTINPKQETENMEVHYHPHLHGKTKKWKEYLLEFSMIFLAVTMGFFAESYREHLVDHTKEKEYMVQLVDDLKEDMGECGVNNNYSVVSLNTRIGNYCDTLIDLLSVTDPSTRQIAAAYYIYKGITRDWFTAYFKDATWSQLKNSGGFRNISNSNVARQINDYYKWANVINDYKDEIKDEYSAINYNEGRKVFDQRMGRRTLDSMESKPYTILLNSAYSINQYVSDTMGIRYADFDAQTILRLCNDLRTYKGLLVLYSQSVNSQGTRAGNLVQLINKEYSLSDQ